MWSCEEARNGPVSGRVLWDQHTSVESAAVMAQKTDLLGMGC
jgi:hypothetical protein